MTPILNYTEWVKAAAVGETTAWNKLHRTFYPGMYVIALPICRNPEVASDVVQEAFIKAYLKLSQLKDSQNFPGWLRQIVTHMSYRALVRHQKNTSLESLALEKEAYWEDEMNRQMEQISSQNQLYSALAQLPDVLHSTLVLRYFSNYQTYEQIAAILAVPIGTVRSRLSEAKRKLEEAWKKHDDASDVHLRENEEWNSFYQSLYGEMHAQESSKIKFINHLQHSQILFPNGKSSSGGQVLENMVEEDRRVGSWLQPVRVFSSGRVSVIEAQHFNSSEHPDHCPPTSVAIINRDKGKASRVFFHPSEK
ncbi:RNA polymerase sigma factor [Adhaeribacter pallidiroseus]|uniref:ECF RNA polymerase sigma factor SigW n=1 Tax=Adhaeribacter pallidiroseus TaxID=2072847 RepID=A0A369QPD4_9BACT|nr:sigma-70 family RNA polymerase sigma factor [Adhaeribacter pallidiroseus]RDC66250.1 hypothetical protein AHMF7616_04881 [Adhaeribacter pallidiroseus]